MKKTLLLLILLCITSFLFAQYGKLDITFNNTGKKTYQAGSHAARSLALPTGDVLILLDETCYPPTYGHIVKLTRINSNGQLDATFGTNGYITLTSSVNFQGLGMRLGNDSSVFIIGDDPAPGLSSKAVVMKIDYDGNKFTGYGSQGESIICIAQGDLQIYGFDIDHNNRVYVTGNKNNVPWKSFVTCIKEDGQIDNDFGTNGVKYLTSGSTYRFTALHVVDSNRILLAGHGNGLAQCYMLDASGNMVQSFGANGIKTFSMGNSGSGVTHIASGSNQEIYLAGRCYPVPTFSHSVNWLCKMDTNGNIDTTFAGGSYNHQIRKFAMGEDIYNLKVHPNGNILLSFYSYGPMDGTYYQNPFLISIKSILPSGHADTLFGTNGLFLDSVLNGGQLLKDIAIDPQNRIWITSINQVTDDFKLFRLNGKYDQTIVAPSSVNKTYGDTAFPFSYSNSANFTVTEHIADTNIVSLSSGTMEVRNAGSTYLTLSANGSQFYNPAQVIVPVTISKKELSVTVLDTLKAIYTPNPVFDYTLSGFVNGESAVVIDTLPVVTSVAGLSSPAGPYPIVAANAFDNNYSFRYINGTLTIIDYTDIQDSEQEKLTLYPNPASSKVYIKLVKTDVLIRLYSVEGQLVLEKNLNGDIPDEIEVDVSTLSSGTYLLQIQNQESRQQSLLIVR